MNKLFTTLPRPIKNGKMLNFYNRCLHYFTMNDSDIFSFSNENSLLSAEWLERDVQTTTTMSSLGSSSSFRSGHDFFVEFLKESERPGSVIEIATLSSLLDIKDISVPRYELGVFFGKDQHEKAVYGYRQAFSTASTTDICNAFVNGNYGHVLMRNDADELAQYRAAFNK